MSTPRWVIRDGSATASSINTQKPSLNKCHHPSNWPKIIWTQTPVLPLVSKLLYPLNPIPSCTEWRAHAWESKLEAQSSGSVSNLQSRVDATSQAPPKTTEQEHYKQPEFWCKTRCLTHTTSQHFSWAWGQNPQQNASKACPATHDKETHIKTSGKCNESWFNIRKVTGGTYHTNRRKRKLTWPPQTQSIWQTMIEHSAEEE